jgi:hypothetical protein
MDHPASGPELTNQIITNSGVACLASIEGADSDRKDLR